jgi:hypothetical protein
MTHLTVHRIGSVQKSISKVQAIRDLTEALGQVDAEFRSLQVRRWIVGRPFLRLERARSVADQAADVLRRQELADLQQVLDRYAKLFDAIGKAARSLGSKDAVILTPQMAREFESVRSATQTLYETLAHGDVWK